MNKRYTDSRKRFQRSSINRAGFASVLLAAFLFLPVSVQAQYMEIGYSHNSVAVWGVIKEAQNFNATLTIAEYHHEPLVISPSIRYVYLHLRHEEYDMYEEPAFGRFHGLFLIPFNFRFETFVNFNNRIGVGRFHEPLVNKNGKKTNFLLEAGISKDITPRLALSVAFSHISNMNRGLVNPGVDNLIGSVIVRFD